MKISNEKILNDAAQLKEISNKQLPIKVSYAIAKNISKLEADLKTYNEERAKLIKKYVEIAEDGQILQDGYGQIVFKDNSKELWEKDIKELLSVENEIDIHKFNISELEGYSMKPSELVLIEYMIEG